MTSLHSGIEPRAQPRLAAGALLIHLLAAALPWIARCALVPAAMLSLLALAGLAATISRVPGPHCRLRRLACSGDEWLAMIAGTDAQAPARLGPGTRVFSGLVVLDLRVGRQRLGWLLPRAAVGRVEFRRLKARLRLAC